MTHLFLVFCFDNYVDSQKLFKKSAGSFIPCPMKQTHLHIKDRTINPTNDAFQNDIDPNLEGTHQTTMRETDSPMINQSDASQYSQDAVLQALFNEGSSHGGFQCSEDMFSGINWADMLANNDPSILESTASTLGPPQQLLTSTSPLRITSGLEPTPTPPPSTTPTSLPLSPKHGVLDLPGQAGAIGSINQQVETLEAAIERLVGSLPNTIDDKQFDVPGHTEDLFAEADDFTSHPNDAEHKAFNPEAFINSFRV